MSKIKSIKALRQSMTKTFKEYLGGFRIGNLDSMSPMASLGDLPPKGAGDKDSRGVGLNANKNRIPRKPGQKAGSDKHSDLYTDENPKDTVPVKFKTVSDIRDTLSRSDFKSKDHARQSQIINLIL